MTESSADQIPSLQLPILKFPALCIYLLEVRDKAQGLLIHTKHSATRPHPWLCHLTPPMALQPVGNSEGRTLPV